MCVNAVWLQYTGGRGEQCAGTVRSAKKCATFAKVKSICRFIRLSVPDHKNSSFTLPAPFTHSKFLSLVSFHFIWLWVCDLVLVPKPLLPSSLTLSLSIPSKCNRPESVCDSKVCRPWLFNKRLNGKRARGGGWHAVLPLSENGIHLTIFVCVWSRLA